MSRRSVISGQIIGTGRWSEAERADGMALLRSLLAGVGEPKRERVFRMNVTLCLHRVMSDADLARSAKAMTPATATNLAGPPIEILFETEEGSPSTRPCANPKHVVIDPKRPDLWAPGECGSCPSCVARKAALLGNLRRAS